MRDHLTCGGSERWTPLSGRERTCAALAQYILRWVRQVVTWSPQSGAQAGSCGELSEVVLLLAKQNCRVFLFSLATMFICCCPVRRVSAGRAAP